MDKAGQIADRICEGHKKLWHAWDAIRDTPEPKQVKLLQDWDRAVRRQIGDMARLLDHCNGRSKIVGVHSCPSMPS